MTMEPDELRNAPPATLDMPVCRALDQSIELRAADEDDQDNSPGTLVGNFSLFDEWYEINSWFEGHFVESIAPGAFKRTIKNRSGQSPVRVLLEHGYDPQVGDKPLGVPDILEERDQGPYAETPLFDTSYNRDLAPAIRGGGYGQSFRFQVLVDEWVEEPGVSDHNPKGIPERTIKEVRLIEFGPTVFPASPATNESTGLRSTTDEFYERLRRRDPASYDQALARTQALRLPKAPDAPEVPEVPARVIPELPAPAGVIPKAPEPETPTGDQEPGSTTTEDPQKRQIPDSPTPPAAPAREHSEDKPATHSEETPRSSSTDKKGTPMDETMTVEERASRQSEIRARLTEIDNEHRGATLPAEVQEEWDKLRSEFDEHTDAIQAAETRRAELAQISPDDPKRTERVVPRKVGAPAGPARRTVENIYDLAEVRRHARSIDELPALYRENALRAVEEKQFPGAEDRAAAQACVERLLAKVDDKDGTIARRILVTGSPVYERAFGKYVIAQSTAGLTSEEQRALAMGAGGTGGFAVPFQLDPTIILTNNGSLNPLREISRVEQIVGKEWDGITSAGVTVSRAAEATETSDNAPTLVQPTVKAERVQGFIPFSVEVDQDWTQLQAEMTRLLTDAKDVEEADSFVNGNGTAPNANGIIATLNASSNVTANTFTVAGLYSLEDAVPDRFLDDAKFLGNRSVYNLIRQFDTAGGANLWVRLGDGAPPELIGYPAYRTSAMPDGSLSINDKYLLLGDFKQFLIVDRVGMMVDLVPHLFGANRRPTGQRGIFALWRNNSKILADNAFRVLFKAA